jgi:hypothetical protein
MVQCFSSKQGTLGLIARTAFKKKKSGMAVDAVIPATLEAEIGGSQFAASLGKSKRTYLKKKQKGKES